MLLAALAIVAGLLILLWAADRFVEGAAATARHFGMPSLLIGMVIVGFGTSAPEMVVSAISSWEGNPGIALGNAYGSNITNIALILGATAVVSPIAVQSGVLRKELPVLTIVTALAVFLLFDNQLTRTDATIHIVVLALLMVWTIRQGMAKPADALSVEMESEMKEHAMPLKAALLWLVVGLIGLVLSSRMLVWGAVEIAHAFGVSDLIIGLTIVAIGTSLPELASSIVAARKNEHDIALGNVIGSNLFNTLGVVGIAGVIRPMDVGQDVLNRDVTVMVLLTVSLFVLGYGFKGPGRINRLEGGALLACYVGYSAYLASTVFGAS